MYVHVRYLAKTADAIRIISWFIAVCFVELQSGGSVLERLANVYAYNSLDRDITLQDWMTSVIAFRQSSGAITPELMTWVVAFVKKYASAKHIRGWKHLLLMYILNHTSKHHIRVYDAMHVYVTQRQTAVCWWRC